MKTLCTAMMSETATFSVDQESIQKQEYRHDRKKEQTSRPTEAAFMLQMQYLWKKWPPDIVQPWKSSSKSEMDTKAQAVKHEGSCKLRESTKISDWAHGLTLVQNLNESMLHSKMQVVKDEKEQTMVWEVSETSHVGRQTSGLDIHVAANKLYAEGTVQGKKTFMDPLSIFSIDNCIDMLRKCREERILSHAKHVHAQICSCGLEAQVAISNYIVPMFVECGSLSDAQQVFNLLPSANEISWTALILGHVHCGQSKDVFTIYQKMQQVGVHPKSYTIVALLQACAALKDLEGGSKIHAEAFSNGYIGDDYVGNSLINMYVQCGSVLQAEEVFNNLPVRDVVSWTSLMAGYVEHGFEEDALHCFEEMQAEGTIPCEATFTCMLKACGNLMASIKGRLVHVEVIKKGYDQCLQIGNSLVGLYGKCRALDEARQVFNQLKSRDVVSWTAVISVYADYGPGQEALKLYESMQIEGVNPNGVTLTCVLKACGNIGSEYWSHEAHTQVILMGFENDFTVGNSLVSMYAKRSAFVEADHVFNKLPVRDAVSWTALIAGYTECGHELKALECFQDMQFQGIPADAFTYSCALKACSCIGALDMGRQIHVNIVTNDLGKDGPICNALIDMYIKCGSPSEAQEVFDEMDVRTVVSWTSLIGGYAEHEAWSEVFRCFEQMQAAGVSPNAIAVACVLRACGSIGAIEKGRAIHKDLAVGELDMNPSVAHSLIDMYAKCGSLSDARAVFDKLPVHDVIAYSVLIKGYGANREGGKAVECFETMLQQGVKPDSVTFLSLLTACCHGSLVHEGHEYFKMMREEHGIEPSIEHYVCMVGLFAKSGRLYEAERFLEMLGLPSQQRTWAVLLSACKTYGEEELGGRSFQQLVDSNPHAPAWYMLMADICTGSSKGDTACRLEEVRKHSGIWKEPASALIEVGSEIHEFVAGNNQSKQVSEMLSTMNARLKKEGHMPNVDSILKQVSDNEKELSLCEHAEKLALAFGLLHTPQGQTLRVTKSMRVCNDCHDASKILSKIEKREIILRDDCTVHHFKDGSCSCGDNF